MRPLIEAIKNLIASIKPHAPIWLLYRRLGPYPCETQRGAQFVCRVFRRPREKVRVLSACSSMSQIAP